MLDNDVFIEVIKKNKVLWKTSDKNHKNKILIKKLWEDIQATLFPSVSVDDLKKRWKNLKDQYRKELKRLPQSSPGVPLATISTQWRYFEPLSFLRDEFGVLVSGNSQDSNSNPPEYDDDLLQPITKTEFNEIENYEVIYEHHAQMSPKSDDEYEPQKDTESRKRPIPNKIREEMMEIERKKLKLIEDEVKRNALEKSDSYHYFMSLLPEVEKLPSLQKMRFRSKVMTALIEELTAVQQSQMSNESQMSNQSQLTDQSQVTNQSQLTNQSQMTNQSQLTNQSQMTNQSQLTNQSQMTDQSQFNSELSTFAIAHSVDVKVEPV